MSIHLTLSICPTLSSPSLPLYTCVTLHFPHTLPVYSRISLSLSIHLSACPPVFIRLSNTPLPSYSVCLFCYLILPVYSLNCLTLRLPNILPVYSRICLSLYIHLSACPPVFIRLSNIQIPSQSACLSTTCLPLHLFSSTCLHIHLSLSGCLTLDLSIHLSNHPRAFIHLTLHCLHAPPVYPAA